MTLDSTASSQPNLRDDASELKEELRWAAARPESLWLRTQSATDDDDEDSRRPPPPDLQMLDAFEMCLTQWETDAYREYIRQSPNSVYMLNQNPLRRATYARDRPMGFNLQMLNVNH